MASITLDELRRDIENSYGPFVIRDFPGGDVTLLPALRLTKAKRAEVSALQSALTGASGDGFDEDVVVGALHDLFRAVAATPADAERLIGEFGDDLAALMVLIEKYTEQTQPGEAESSPS